MSWIAAAGLAVSAGVSIARGAKQKKDAKKMADGNPFPNQEIPAAILENQQKAKLYENQGLPSEQYQQGIRNINRNSAAALITATDRRGGLGMASTIQQGANDAKLNLDVANANAVRQNQQRAMQQNNVLGQWQNNVWDWNKRQKYMQTAAAARALMGAGNANINQGIDRGLSAATKVGDSYVNKKGGFVDTTDLDTPLQTGKYIGDIQGTVNQDDFNIPNAPTVFGGNNNGYNSIMGLNKPFVYNNPRSRRI